MPGATDSSTAIARSASVLRASSLQPPLRFSGAYCTTALMMCRPSGARLGSMSVGMSASTTGVSLISPYLLASNAFSVPSTLGAITMRPRSSCSALSPFPAAVNAGSRSTSRLSFAVTPVLRVARRRRRRSGPVLSTPSRPRSVRFGSSVESTIGAAISSPFASATPVTRPSRSVIAATDAPVRISAPKPRAASASAPARAPGPPIATTVWPAAPPSAPSPVMPSKRSVAPVPGDIGPTAL